LVFWKMYAQDIARNGFTMAMIALKVYNQKFIILRFHPSKSL